MRHLDVPNYYRATTRSAEDAVAKRFVAAFAPVAKQCAAALRAQASKVYKIDDTPEKTAADIVDALDLSSIDGLSDDLAEDLAPVAAEAGPISARVGLGSGDAFVNVVNDRAVKAVNDGLAPAIKGMSDATRDMLRKHIADQLRQNVSTRDIAAGLGDAYALSDDRARTIAQTEVSRANSVASVASYKVARDKGVNVFKRWLAEPGCCAACSGNAAAGAIDLDDNFPSGHPCPAAHPGCRCATAPSLGEATKMAEVPMLFKMQKDGSTETYEIGEAPMAAYHRQAEHLRIMRDGMSDVLKDLRSCLEESSRADASDSTLEKGATSSLTKSFSRTLAEAQLVLTKLNSLSAEATPLPWDVLLAKQPPAGTG